MNWNFRRANNDFKFSFSETNKDFRPDATFPLVDESHGGEDVPIYAMGPLAHLFHSSHEVSAEQIYHKISNTRRTKFSNLNGSRLVLQLSLSNEMKPDVKSRVKM